MTARAYYNEIDPYAAAWLRNLIAAGHIAPGDVDERSIVDVTPGDLAGYTQCHFFAGIGVWSYALRLVKWPDDRPVWTGSCPCQPFSAAGKRGGFGDERHLWPVFHRLIAQRRPAVVLGEQVASKDGLAWLDAVQADLEASGYAFGALDTCAAGVGAPHIRQRLWWVGVADTVPAGRAEGRAEGRAFSGRGQATGGSRSVGLCDGQRTGLEGHRRHGDDRDQPGRIGTHPDGSASLAGAVDRMADASDGARQRGISRPVERGLPTGACEDAAFRPCPVSGHWGDADWLFCRDGKWRPVEPGTFPLAHGAPARVGRLRAYGNAIVAQAAAEFIRAYLESEAVDSLLG